MAVEEDATTSSSDVPEDGATDRWSPVSPTGPGSTDSPPSLLDYFGRGRERIASYAQRYRRRHPDDPLILWFLPPKIDETYTYMNDFDPEFADTFYTLDWQAGFGAAATLRNVAQPAILVHANWRITDTGILEGAMTDEDATRACDLLADCRIERVDTGHGFHFEEPDHFVELIREIRNQPEA